MIWLPHIRWRDLDAWEAMELGLEQAARFGWEAFEFAWLGFGFIFIARVKR